ncbi:MAG: hypothetical protein AB8B67_01905 [Rickettsiaceae bacterium]
MKSHAQVLAIEKTILIHTISQHLPIDLSISNNTMGYEAKRELIMNLIYSARSYQNHPDQASDFANILNAILRKNNIEIPEFQKKIFDILNDMKPQLLTVENFRSSLFKERLNKHQIPSKEGEEDKSDDKESCFASSSESSLDIFDSASMSSDEPPILGENDIE